MSAVPLIGVTFEPDMADEAIVQEAGIELTRAGADEHRLAAWALRYGRAAIDRCDDAVGMGYAEGAPYE